MLDITELERYLEERMEAEHVPGLALAVIAGKQVMYKRGFGVTAVGAPSRPVSPETVFPVASLTKPLTATTILRLVELGLLDLDEPPLGLGVGGELARRLTLRRLLSHTSGLPAGPPLDEVSTMSLTQLVASALEDWTPPSTPLRRPVYSNIGIAVAAHLAEIRAETPFADLVREHVLHPLGMTRTGFAEPAPEFVAMPHATDDGRLVMRPRRPDAPGYAPARGALSTVADMASFACMLLGREPQVLGARALAEMLSTQSRHSPLRETGFGLGVEVFSYKGLRGVGHNGDIGSFKGWMVCIPSEGVGVVMICNATPWLGLTPVPWRVLDAVVGLPADPWARSRYAMWPSFAVGSARRTGT